MTSDTWEAHYATGAGLRLWPCEELVRFVAGRQFESVLEAGCGNGGNLWFLVEHAHRLAGVDSSAAALGRAVQYMTTRLHHLPELYKADVLAMPFEDGSFDLVVDCMTSQHLPWKAHKKAFAEYRRVLRQGGELFLYHLDGRTECERRPGANPWDVEYLGLFPTVGLTCLPSMFILTECVHDAGFIANPRGLMREYQNGDVASYTVVTGRAA